MRVLLLSLTLLGWPLASGAEMARPRSGQVAPVPDTTFRHDTHEGVACLECHQMTSTHGAYLVHDISDCQSCHHAPERVDEGCAACHVAAEMQDVVHTIRRTFTLSVRDAPYDREISFKHLDHEERECTECHADGPSLALPQLDCQGCHEEHHAETASGCMSCHREPPEDAHTLAVHQTCSGSGCHQESPVQTPPGRRTGCLWCHEEQVDHEPEGECADCHVRSVSSGLEW